MSDDIVMTREQRKALSNAWADHCGVERGSEEAAFGWSRDRGIFAAGWQAATAHERARIVAALEEAAIEIYTPMEQGSCDRKNIRVYDPDEVQRIIKGDTT